MSAEATVFVPGSIGNVGPGFDVLGLAVDGIGDRVTVVLIDGGDGEVTVLGQDAGSIPRDPLSNSAAIAARALLDAIGRRDPVRITIDKGLPLSGGLGGSAASSVGGALAAMLAAGVERNDSILLRAALAGEAAVAGPHLDNIGPSLLGGLVLVLSNDPPDVVRLPTHATWWIALATPALRLETRAGRAILPEAINRSLYIGQMARTTALAHAFATGDGDLMHRALDDRFAEPIRKPLIPRFDEVKRAALDAGACGASISGSGPTIFALATDEVTTHRVGAAMAAAFGEIEVASHVARVADAGAREVR